MKLAGIMGSKSPPTPFFNPPPGVVNYLSPEPLLAKLKITDEELLKKGFMLDRICAFPLKVFITIIVPGQKMITFSDDAALYPSEALLAKFEVLIA